MLLLKGRSARGGGVDVALAEFQEASARAQEFQGAADGLSRQGVEDDVDALPAGEVADVLGEVQVAGVQDVADAEHAQQVAFGRGAGGGDDVGAAGPGELEGGEADAAGGTVDKDGLAGLETREALESVVDGEVDHRQGGGFGERHAVGDGSHEAGVDGHVGAEATGRERVDAVAWCQVGDIGADCGDRAGAFKAQGRPIWQRGLRARGQEANGEHDVAVIECGRCDGDGDLVGCGLLRPVRGPGEPGTQAGVVQAQCEGR